MAAQQSVSVTGKVARAVAWQQNLRVCFLPRGSSYIFVKVERRDQNRRHSTERYTAGPVIG